MKKLIYLLFVVILTACSSKQTTVVSDWEKLGLKGEIESVRNTTYHAKSEAKGIVRGESIINSSISQNEFVAIGDYVMIKEIIFERDGLMYSQININPYDNYCEHRVIYKYENNLLKESKTFDIELNIENAITYEYDKKGNLIKMMSFDSRGNIDRPFTVSTDIEDDIKTITMLQSNDAYTINKMETKYKDNLVVSILIYIEKDGGKFISKNTIEYNELNWVTKRVMTFENNDSIRKDIPNSHFTVYFEYPKLDANGNWTEMHIYISEGENSEKGATPNFITERNITYFETVAKNCEIIMANRKNCPA